MISGIRYSPLAPLTWWKSRPLSAAISRKSGCGAVDEADVERRHEEGRRDEDETHLLRTRESGLVQRPQIPIDGRDEVGLIARGACSLAVRMYFSAFAVSAGARVRCAEGIQIRGVSCLPARASCRMLDRVV